MSLTMQGEVVLTAPRERVWAALNDPEILKACIPGCESLVREGDHAFIAAAVLKIGPIKARFSGKVILTDLDPPNGYRISGEGQGGLAGFAKGGASVALSDAEDGTRLRYDVDATVGGKVAQLGGRLLNSVAKKYADGFFECFVQKLAEEITPQSTSNGDPATARTLES